MKKPRIVIAAGGSGGHIFPAVALARTIRRDMPEAGILFVGGDRSLDRRIFEKEGFAFRLLSANKLVIRNKLLLPIFFVKLLLDLIRSFSIMVAYKPTAAIGFGGYVSFPVILAAKMCRVATTLHEQNVVPGRANAFLFRCVDRIAVSFEETLRFLGAAAGKAVVTGNPIRRELFTDDRPAGLKKFGLDGARRTILVMGGSQGAHRLNEIVVEALAGSDADTRGAIQVIHLTGVKDYGWVLGRYDALGIAGSVHSFIDRVEEAYSASDIIVTRSGASAIFEAAFFARPMVLVPYPYAMNHQLENARAFAAKGAAIILEEKTLTPEMFRETIISLMADASRCRALADAAKRSSVPDASERLAAVVAR